MKFPAPAQDGATGRRGTIVDVKQAIAAAKAYANHVFSDENVANVGVEEVEKEDGIWRITLGLSRPWHEAGAASLFDPRAPQRTYHVFSVSDQTGEVSGFRLRERA